MESEKINFKDKFYNSFNKIISIYSITVIIMMIPITSLLMMVFMAMAVGAPGGSFPSLIEIIIVTLITLGSILFFFLIPVLIFSTVIHILLKLMKSPIKYIQTYNLSLFGFIIVFLMKLIFSNIILFGMIIIILFIFSKILSDLSKINKIYSFIINVIGMLSCYGAYLLYYFA